MSAPDPLDRHLGRKLRQLRTERGLSMAQLGLLVGVSYQQMQKYEIGINRISAANLYRVAAAIGVPASVFFQGLGGDDTRAASTPLCLETHALKASLDRVPDPAVRLSLRRLIAALTNGGD